MDQIVKTEEPKESVLEYYVDDDGNIQVTNEVLSIIDNNFQQSSSDTYIIPEFTELSEQEPFNNNPDARSNGNDKWSDDEIQQLLVFYNDNKETFVSGVATKRQLWAVACNALLTSKTPDLCENKLRNLKKKYYSTVISNDAGANYNWVHFDLCHQAFHDEFNNNPDARLTGNEKWSDDEIRQLLVFYNDNKETFVSGVATKRQLWAVACDAHLSTKTPDACENKFRNLKKKYYCTVISNDAGANYNWLHFDLCHQAFHDDANVVNQVIFAQQFKNSIVHVTSEPQKAKEKVLAVKKITHSNKNDTNNVLAVDSSNVILVPANTYQNNSNRINRQTKSNENVERMLHLYTELKDKQNELWPKSIWEIIAENIGDEPDYWHKRFLNFKQHYIKILDQQKDNKDITWPYMSWFQKIYQNDKEFLNKYVVQSTNLNLNEPKADSPIMITDNIKKEQNHETTITINIVNESTEWNNTELTMLTKYYFDSYNEFIDPTIPNEFLWNEVGRILEKEPNNCETKFNESKTEHIDKYISCDYSLTGRIPFSIILDNIICLEAKSSLDLINSSNKKIIEFDNSTDTDELVQFMYNSIELLKDSVCYYVCFIAISKKLDKTFVNCKRQWDFLVSEYKKILNFRNNSVEQLNEWRYTEVFDAIFADGMDDVLFKIQEESTTVKKIVNKTEVKHSKSKYDTESSEDELFYDNRGFIKRKQNNLDDTTTIKILEFYLKNKDKMKNLYNSKSWTIIAKELRMATDHCLRNFKRIKQNYYKHLQQEINKPDQPILWPCYALCKKAFGYRAVKSRLKSDVADIQDWTPKDIKILIRYFGENSHDLNNDIGNAVKYRGLGIDKTESECCAKMIELRDSYNRVKKWKTLNPTLKSVWKYYNMFEDIYEYANENIMQLEPKTTMMDIEEHDDNDEGEDYTILVIPEGQELSDIENAKIISKDNLKMIQSSENKTQYVNSWNRNLKKQLLRLYLKHRKMNYREIWSKISEKINKDPIICRKMFVRILKRYREARDMKRSKINFRNLLEKILSLKPNLMLPSRNNSDENTFNDVVVPDDKLNSALEYYLDNLEDFTDPKYDKNYVWTKFSVDVKISVSKLYNKINYLLRNSTDDNMYSDLLKEILLKETKLKEQYQESVYIENFSNDEKWSDDETDILLNWYLENLDKYLNPKMCKRYLWVEASKLLQRSAVLCADKVFEVKVKYKEMIKNSCEELNSWRFYDICQNIYSTSLKIS